MRFIEKSTISSLAIAVDQIVRNTQLQISTSVKVQEKLQGNFYKFYN